MVGVNTDGSVACAFLQPGASYVADSDGNVGEHTSIAIRNNGLPIISYHATTIQNLMAYDCANAACSSGTARTLDSNVSVGQHTSVAIRDDGLPIISYADTIDIGNNNLKVFSCGDPRCAQ